MGAHPKRPFLTFGLPFLTFMILGHQALAYIGQGRYDVSWGLTFETILKFFFLVPRATNAYTTNARSMCDKG